MESRTKPYYQTTYKFLTLHKYFHLSIPVVLRCHLHSCILAQNSSAILRCHVDVRTFGWLDVTQPNFEKHQLCRHLAFKALSWTFSLFLKIIDCYRVFNATEISLLWNFIFPLLIESNCSFHHVYMQLSRFL